MEKRGSWPLRNRDGWRRQVAGLAGHGAVAVGAWPLAAIPPPEADRVDRQQGPQNGLPARISDAGDIERFYQAVAASPPPPGPQTLEQRVQELDWQDVTPDVLESVSSLGKHARAPAVIARAIELGGWTREELNARAWHTGSGVVSHIEHIVLHALQRELGLTMRLRQIHGVYSLTEPTDAGGFGVTYRRANATKPAERELQAHLVDLSELERATERHMNLQDRLADVLRGRGIDPRSPGSGQPEFDLAFEHDGERFVVEVKSGDPVSPQQIRLGTGQILEYCHILRNTDADAPVHAVLLIEAEPPYPWSPLANAIGVRLLRADELEASLTALPRPSQRFASDL